MMTNCRPMGDDRFARSLYIKPLSRSLVALDQGKALGTVRQTSGLFLCLPDNVCYGNTNEESGDIMLKTLPPGLDFGLAVEKFALGMARFERTNQLRFFLGIRCLCCHSWLRIMRPSA